MAAERLPGGMRDTMQTDSGDDPVFIEALEWFVRLQDEEAGDRAAFEIWLQADPVHQAAFARAQALWERFDIVPAEARRLRSGGDASRRGVMLGGLALLVGAPVAYALTPPGLFADFQTGIAERRSVSLPDGNAVELGSNSALSLDFSTHARRVILHRGQANFDVSAASGPAELPFVVQAGAASVQALASQFDVKLGASLTEISVLRDAVSVSGPLASTAALAPTVVEAGWQIALGADGAGAPVQFDAASVQAWRRDRLVFEDVPLRQVLTELERYRYGRIVLFDGDIGAIPVTAVFDTLHTAATLEALAETLPIRVLNAGGYVTFVYAA